MRITTCRGECAAFRAPDPVGSPGTQVRLSSRGALDPRRKSAGMRKLSIMGLGVLLI